MTKNKTRLALAASAAIAVMVLGPLNANAAPNGVFQRGECGNPVVTDFVNESNAQNAIIPPDTGGVGKVLQATVPAASSDNGGLVTNVSGLRPVRDTGSGWQNTSVRANLNGVPLGEVFFVLFFDNGAKKVVPFSQISSNNTGWRTYNVSNRDLAGYGRNLLQKKVYFLVRSGSGDARTVKFGRVSVNHFGQGNIDPTAIFPGRVTNTCGATDQPS